MQYKALWTMGGHIRGKRLVAHSTKAQTTSFQPSPRAFNSEPETPNPKVHPQLRGFVDIKGTPVGVLFLNKTPPVQYKKVETRRGLRKDIFILML